MNRKIIKREYYAVLIELASPCSISNGEDYYTDSDIMRNGSGEVFIPGTSIAGAFRNNLGVDKNRDCMLGYSQDKEGKMSSLYFSDFYFDEDPVVSVRDGVELSGEKTVLNKFDMEIIESGAQGTLFLNYVLREKDDEQEFENSISAFLQAVQNGSIRIGANKNRGFGRLNIKKVGSRTFDSHNVSEWRRFLAKEKDIDSYPMVSYKSWSKKQICPADKYVKIKVPLTLNGGISIRRYSSKPQEADFEHITCNGNPVIPGTSWNGAIRAAVIKNLKELGHKNPETVIKQWFGIVEKIKSDEAGKNKVKAQQSQIIFGESKIENAERLPMTRNKINRFDSSTISGALYSEIAYFGGKTCLEIMVRKDPEGEYLAILGMLKIIIQDIQSGYIAIGGQTAIGRGIFGEDKEKNVEYSEEIDEEICMSKLYTLFV